MPPPKRRTKGGRPVHDGRVTRSSTEVPPSGEDARAPQPAVRPRPPATTTPRYTAAKPSFRLRPGRHKLVGLGLVILGVLVVAVNDIMLLTPSLTLLPGGHNELFLFGGLVVAGYGTWWFGWYDRRR